MSEAPLKKQEGLSKEDLAKMKPIEQEYKWDNPSLYPEEHNISIQDNISVSTQESNLKHLIKRNLVLFDKDKASIDNSDQYALDTCLRDFSDRMASAIVSAIHAQKVIINTPVATTDTITSGVLTSLDSTNVFTGTGTGTGTEYADTLGTKGSKINID